MRTNGCDCSAIHGVSSYFYLSSNFRLDAAKAPVSKDRQQEARHNRFSSARRGYEIDGRPCDMDRDAGDARMGEGVSLEKGKDYHAAMEPRVRRVS